MGKIPNFNGKSLGLYQNPVVEGIENEERRLVMELQDCFSDVTTPGN